MKAYPIAYLLGAAAVLIQPPFARAAASDYKFEAVSPEFASGGEVTFEIRLLDKSGTPVAGATWIRTRLDMAPDNMAQHTAEVTAGMAAAGAYAFKANFSMHGHWQLNLAARVPGEAETVTGKLIFTVKDVPASPDAPSHEHAHH